MDTSRITEPITSRLPSAGPIVSTVSDITSGLAEHLNDQVGDVDLAEAARRTKRVVASVVPWMEVSRGHRIVTRRRIFVGLTVGAIVVAVVLLRRRSTESSGTPPKRDDWSVGSANGANPAAARPDREPAPTGA